MDAMRKGALWVAALSCVIAANISWWPPLQTETVLLATSAYLIVAGTAAFVLAFFAHQGKCASGGTDKRL